MAGNSSGANGVMGKVGEKLVWLLQLIIVFVMVKAIGIVPAGAAIGTYLLLKDRIGIILSSLAALVAAAAALVAMIAFFSYAL